MFKTLLMFICALSDISLLLCVFFEIQASGYSIILIAFVMFICIFNIIDRDGYIENKTLLSRSNDINLFVLSSGLFTFILIHRIKYPYYISSTCISQYLTITALNIFNFLFLKMLSIFNILV